MIANWWNMRRQLWHLQGQRTQASKIPKSTLSKYHMACSGIGDGQETPEEHGGKGIQAFHTGLLLSAQELDAASDATI